MTSFFISGQLKGAFAIDRQLHNMAEPTTPTPAPETARESTRIVFCLPGRDYSREFLISWSGLLSECIARGVTPVMSQQYSSVVHFARSKCLGADVTKGANQKPFQGKMPYDYIMWIDSDVVFSPSEFFKLLESPYEVTCGLYMMEDRKSFAAVKTWDSEFFQANGSFQFLDQAALDAEPERYMQVAYAGMGWMLIKAGVMENLKYPWFNYDLQKIPTKDGGLMVDMCSEDVALCRNLAEAGVRVHVDKTCRVGHQKAFVI